jgi:large subunit ribosomal protein L22
MMYSTNADQKETARAQGVGLSISLKESVEVCNYIRGRELTRAIRILEDVITLKQPIPYRRFNRGGVGHRKKMGTGRYPVAVCKAMVKLLRSVQANARGKGLDVDSLSITAILAKQGPRVPHPGRKRGREEKRAHVEVVVSPQKKATVKKAPKKKAAKKEPVEKND